MDQSRPANRILTPVEAAHFLGITPELLYAYTLYPAKKHLGRDTTLPYVKEDGREGFRVKDLKAFDAYLRQPWSDATQDRPHIPTFIVDYLKVECGAQCARCGRGYKLENAHIDDYAASRSHHHHNIIRLCSQCHDEFASQHLIPKTEIVSLKERLIATVRQRIAQRHGWPGSISRMPTPASQFVGRLREKESLLRRRDKIT